jgi:hypothetical protein
MERGRSARKKNHEAGETPALHWKNIFHPPPSLANPPVLLHRAAFFPTQQEIALGFHTDEEAPLPILETYRTFFRRTLFKVNQRILILPPRKTAFDHVRLSLVVIRVPELPILLESQGHRGQIG